MKIYMLLMPWWDHEDKLQFTRMSLTGENVDRRLAFRMMRKWYASAIGRSVDKYTLNKVWKRKFVTRAITEHSINDMLTEMAHESYKAVTDPDNKSEIAEGTE